MVEAATAASFGPCSSPNSNLAANTSSTHLILDGRPSRSRPVPSMRADRDLTLRRGVLRQRTGSGPFVDRPVDDGEWSDLLAEHFGLIDHLTDQAARSLSLARWVDARRG